MIDFKNLCVFLVKDKKATYASGDDSKNIKEGDGSTSLFFEDGDWKYHDNFFGGEPYGGREVVFFEGKPVYIMTYYGNVDESIIDLKDVYSVLREALLLISEDSPYRGPKEYIKDDYLYSNSFVGGVDKFSGIENISLNGMEIYKAQYIGGLVDQRK